MNEYNTCQKIKTLGLTLKAVITKIKYNLSQHCILWTRGTKLKYENNLTSSKFTIDNAIHEKPTITNSNVKLRHIKNFKRDTFKTIKCECCESLQN